MLEGAFTLKQDYAIHSKGVVLPNHILLLFAALAAAIVAQGGYYLPGRIVTTVLAGLALIISMRARIWSAADALPVLLAGAGLAGWAVVRAALAGEPAAGVPTVVSVFCLVAALLVAARTDPAQRAACASVAVGVGALLAMSGWIAVAWRIPSWTTVADGLSLAVGRLGPAGFPGHVACSRRRHHRAGPRGMPARGPRLRRCLGQPERRRQHRQR